MIYQGFVERREYPRIQFQVDGHAPHDFQLSRLRALRLVKLGIHQSRRHLHRNQILLRAMLLRLSSLTPLAFLIFAIVVLERWR